ncbi:MAG: hypothetical protein Hyperionvirus11_57 [Hyperionvirus sp.]|uniref:Uncharacterized protein n=1 Tax=Hyperionvirus sp. TaxID=2487770 RepID=A0A3G5AB06_9VIRU|nr:MAG: hypothetical protein Hyperionvirus11_57 [Hyperionvirus sp.]
MRTFGSNMWYVNSSLVKLIKWGKHFPLIAPGPVMDNIFKEARDIKSSSVM